jgi:hypothetical protein
MELDDSREICFCSYCGTKHIIKDEIVNNTVINNYGRSSKGVDELIADGNVLLGVGRDSEALIKFQKATDAAPGDHRGWLGYARVQAHMGSDSDTPYETAYKLANEKEKETVVSEWIGSMALKNENACRMTYELMIRICGDAVKETVHSVWAAQIKKDVAEKKRFTGTYRLRFSIYGNSLRSVSGFCFSPYGILMIESVSDTLDAGEKGFIASGMRAEADRLSAEEDKFVGDQFTDKLTHSQIQRAKKEARTRDDSPYSLYLKGIADLRASAERLGGNGAEDGTAEKKKGFWSRK